MESHPNDLAIPPEAMSDPQARELLRVWGARGSLNIRSLPKLGMIPRLGASLSSISPGMWREPSSNADP
jgi:hypothetical protein